MIDDPIIPPIDTEILADIAGTFCKNIGKIQDNNTINIKNSYLKIGLFASLLENMYNKTIAIMII